MPALIGKIYVGPGGCQLIVTKGGPGRLTDGDVELRLKDGGEPFATGTPCGARELLLGKRFRSLDGAVEVLLTKPGKGDLRYAGQPLEPKQAKPLPSTD